MEFTCPACNVVLEAQKLEDVRVWKCASCSGLVVTIPTVRKGLDPKAFKEDQYQRRSFLYKLLDGSVSKGLGLDSFFGKYFDD